MAVGNWLQTIFKSYKKFTGGIPWIKANYTPVHKDESLDF